MDKFNVEIFIMQQIIYRIELVEDKQHEGHVMPNQRRLISLAAGNNLRTL